MDTHLATRHVPATDFTRGYPWVWVFLPPLTETRFKNSYKTTYDNIFHVNLVILRRSPKRRVETLGFKLEFH